MLLAWFRSLGQQLKKAARPPGNASPYRNRAILRVEALEDRAVPSTVQVTNLNAAGAGSLAAAVATVDASTDASNSISFAPGLSGWISISSELDLTDTSGKVPNKEIDIQGPGSSVLGIQRDATQGNFRDIWVASGITSTIGGLYVKGGYTNNGAFDPHRGGDGGGILNEGNLTLNNTVVANNTSNGTNGGGGIANYGSLFTNTLTIWNNLARNNGGGLYNAGTADLNAADQIYSNQATGTGGGGIYNDSSATLTLYETSIRQNTASAPGSGGTGGGIYNLGSVTMTEGGLQSNNAPNGNGGGIYSTNGASVNLSGVSISGNSAAYGGGVYVWSGTVTCDHCNIAFNTATTFGSLGCWNAAKGGTLTLTNCTTNGTEGADPRY